MRAYRIVRGNLATLLMVCSFLTPSVGCGAESSSKIDPDQSLVETAQQTYELLLNDYRSGRATGPLHLELLNNWSKRILLSQTQTELISGLNRAELLMEGHEEHVRRMTELEAVVARLAKADKITPAEVAATRFFRLEGEALLAQLDQSRNLLEQRELDVVLPPASEAQPLVVKPKEIIINISRDGGYFVSGNQIDSSEAERLLREASLENPGSQSVVIRAHKETQLQHVVRLMNLCNKIGIHDYSLTTSDD